MFFLISCFLFRLLTINNELGSYCETSDWPNRQALDDDGNYVLSWRVNVNTKQVTFKTEVRTQGWVGFGFTEQSGMTNSDVVIGYVQDSGKPILHDRWSTREELPEIDRHQDWYLISSAKNDTHITIVFNRAWDTGDKEQDIAIKRGARMRVVYAYGKKVPQSPDNVEHHGKHRRGKAKIVVIA